MSLARRVDSAAAMEALGAAVAAAARGCCIYLSGPLAAGKTTFARGFCRARGHRGAVKSPTFTLVETYSPPGGVLHHFDLYRLADPGELEFIGIDDYFDGRADVLVEWPERGAGVIPPADLSITIAIEGQARRVALCARSERGAAIVSSLE